MRFGLDFSIGVFFRICKALALAAAFLSMLNEKPSWLNFGALLKVSDEKLDSVGDDVDALTAAREGRVTSDGDGEFEDVATLPPDGELMVPFNRFNRSKSFLRCDMFMSIPSAILETGLLVPKFRIAAGRAAAETEN